jgi:predicted peptidase
MVASPRGWIPLPATIRQETGMKAIYKPAVPILLFAIFFVMASSARADETGFLNRAVKIGNETYRYQVYVPRDWNKSRKWPVILFLHGAGERGDDGIIQTEVGIGGAIRRHVDRFPAVVVMPQCRKNLWWTQDAMQEQALAAFEQSVKEFNGDPAQFYLTGLSMGGYGTWSIASKHPGKFAALVPVCGGIRPPARANIPDADKAVDPNVDPYAEAAKKIGKTPVWIFHGGADPVVPPDESRKMNDALKAAGGNVKYTEYEKVGHNSWDKAYAEPELMKWMLGQSSKTANSTTSEK